MVSADTGMAAYTATTYHTITGTQTAASYFTITPRAEHVAANAPYLGLAGGFPLRVINTIVRSNLL